MFLPQIGNFTGVDLNLYVVPLISGDGPGWQSCLAGWSMTRRRRPLDNGRRSVAAGRFAPTTKVR